MRGRDEAEAEAEDVWKYLLLGESTCAGGTDQPIRGATVTRRKVSRSHRRPISFNPWIPPPILTLTILTTIPLSLSLVPFIAFSLPLFSSCTSLFFSVSVSMLYCDGTMPCARQSIPRPAWGGRSCSGRRLAQPGPTAALTGPVGPTKSRGPPGMVITVLTALKAFNYGLSTGNAVLLPGTYLSTLLQTQSINLVLHPTLGHLSYIYIYRISLSQ